MSTAKLSCDGCRAHKVRCSKNEPQCDRCRIGNLSCHYTKRRPRTQKPSNLGLDPQYLGVINGILERLDRLEAANNSNNGSPARSAATPSDAGNCNSSHNSSTISNNPSDAVMLDDELDGISADTINLSDTPDDSIEPLLYSMIKQATDLILATLRKSPAPSKAEILTQNALVDLNSALFDIQNASKLRSPFEAIEDDFNIPKESINAWIEDGFNYSRADMFIGLIDWDLVRTIPKIIHSPHVQLDPCILLLYYVILYFGWLLGCESPNHADRTFAERMYARCLTLSSKHQSDDENLVPRLVGAVLMTWMAVENLDYSRSWKFHREACRIARVLELDQLDNPNNQRVDDDQTECKRRGFWQLVQTDYIFRLYFGKPAIITSTRFQVNLPSLKLGTNVGAMTDAIGDTSFVVTSRFAFITTEFFGALESYPNSKPNELNSKIDGLCDEIESLLVEWKIEEALESNTHNEISKWLLADLLIHGYATVILMQQQGNTDFALGPSLERCVRVSRKLLKAFILVSEAQIKVGLISLNLAGAYPFMALFTLYICLLDYSDNNYVHNTEPCSEDIRMMNRLCAALKEPTAAEEGLGLKKSIDTLLTALQRIISRSQL